jgi:glycosyltransferase involved in cell wall biosynthesis
VRIAWFSPVPPDRSGIAAYTAELIPQLTPHLGAIDLYHAGRHDFVWRHRRQPYDLIVYQLGNSAAHDFIWAYLFRYPGLLVLHDAQIHQARALWLLNRLEPRLDDYLAELQANHPDAPPHLGQLFAAGLGGDLYHHWPLVGLAIRASKLTIVHNAHLARRLSREHAGAAIRHVDMGVADPWGTVPSDAATQGTVPCFESTQGTGTCFGSTQGTVPTIRRRFGIPDDALVVAAFGGITPEKRIPQLLDAMATRPPHDMHALLVGQRAAHYDVEAEIARLGLQTRVHVAGYVSDADLPAYLAAADVCWCLRWPSNGETSASWLRCLAAGRPTLITALAQLDDVPSLTVNADGVTSLEAAPDAVSIAIDPVDEPRDVASALAACAADAGLRKTLGANARARFEHLHTLPRMAASYLNVIAEAAARRDPTPRLPAHLRDDGTGTARRILRELGVAELPW